MLTAVNIITAVFCKQTKKKVKDILDWYIGTQVFLYESSTYLTVHEN